MSDQHRAAAAALALRFRAKNICWPKASGGCHGIKQLAIFINL